jgi:hypothetical protein
VQDTPTVVTDDEKAKERAEGDRRNSEEVHRGNPSGIGLMQNLPGHQSRHWDLEIQLDQE